MQRILNIGPRLSKVEPQAGGVVVLFENWIEFCDKELRENNLIIDSNKNNYAFKPLAILIILTKIIYQLSKCDTIILHGTQKDYQWIAPIIVFLAKRRSKKVVLRKFAGNFWSYYSNISGIKKKLVDYALNNSDLLLWETLKQVDFFSEKIKNVPSTWFPNVRKKMPLTRNHEKPYNRKFIFLSRVDKVKGVNLLMDAFNQLGNAYTLDIYGPLSGYSEQDFKNGNYKYKGTVPSERVNSILVNYDFLILPTLWKAEGYPGVIMECFNAGIPIIVSPQGGIPELINNHINGILIKPSVEEIVRTIKQIDEQKFCLMSKAAAETFIKYDADCVNFNILKTIFAL